MWDHHGNQVNWSATETNRAENPRAEFSSRQVLAHLANGDHEVYANAGVYVTASIPVGDVVPIPGGDVPLSHDYCKENAYRFDQRQGTIEIYLWNGSDFSPAPPQATPNFKDPSWLRYRGRWGNHQAGANVAGQSQLESGPEGIFRPGEYAPPLPLS
jgi:hypothetical protein